MKTLLPIFGPCAIVDLYQQAADALGLETVNAGAGRSEAWLDIVMTHPGHLPQIKHTVQAKLWHEFVGDTKDDDE